MFLVLPSLSVLKTYVANRQQQKANMKSELAFAPGLVLSRTMKDRAVSMVQCGPGGHGK